MTSPVLKVNSSPISAVVKGQTMKLRRLVFLFAAFTVLSACLSAGDVIQAKSPQSEYRDAVVKDWSEQEREQGREIASFEALEALVERAQNACDWLESESWIDDDALDEVRKELDDARAFLEKGEDAVDGDEPALLGAFSHYLKLRGKLRAILMSNPDVSGQPLVFLKEERFVWQMLHEFLSYYYDQCGMRGGGVYVLKEPGKSFETESLTDGLFPRGVFQTLSLSYDAKTVYFSFADFSQTQTDDQPKTNVDALMARPYVKDFAFNYMKDPRSKFHLYRMTLDDRKVEQLTDGCEDDFDPTEAPDGSLIFMSTRRGGYGRCHGHYEPLNVHTLHRLNADKSVTCISWHETNEWQPTFLHDGRVLYTRWDYVDRAASRHHGLWTTNPDGTNSAIFFGNYTYDVNACYQAKPIPNSNKVMFLGGAHHLDVGGTILAFDPSKMRYDPETGKDDLRSIEFLTPDVPLPEVAGAENRICERYYFSPYPLSEDAWITSYSHRPLGGYLAGTRQSGKLGIYYGDRFGNLELLYENKENDESCLYPLPLIKREKPAIVPSSIENGDSNTGTFVLSNVYESLMPLPKDRKIKELRVVQLLPKGPDYQSDLPRTGRPNAANARMLLGSVPVEEDGSAHFRAPARVPLYFQAIDEDGKAVQSMRSIVYLQPGENRGCVGCHEQAQTTLTNDSDKRSLASLREPSEILAGPENTRPFSYPRFIQPILDARCVKCHDGSEGKPGPVLTGEIEAPFTRSYNQLMSYMKWYEWGDANFRDIVTIPGECGADISPFSKIIVDDNHANIGLTDEEYRNLMMWCDLNVPFYGVYELDEQARQLKGELVDEPALQ